MKRFRRSPVAIICYVIAILITCYFIGVTISTLITIHDYYAQYDMQAGFGETMAYLLQNGLTILVNAVVVFMAGFILEEVRKLNPSNWTTDEERAEAREAKQLAREQKQAAKGEAARIRAGVVTEAEAAKAGEEIPVEADFSDVADEVVAEAADDVAAEAVEAADAAEEAAGEAIDAAEEPAVEAADAAEEITDEE